jgi:toxin HigB-1
MRTEALHQGEIVPELRNIRAVALRKLDMLPAAAQLSDLRAPPSNRLEALKGDRQGQYGIRIDDQFRICFIWRDGGAEQAEIVDYH